MIYKFNHQEIIELNEQEKMTKLTKEIVNWIRSEVKKANAKGVIVALSGGIDSAVVGYLAKLAFPDNSLAIFLNIESSVTQKRNALRIFEDTKIKWEMFDITQNYSDFLKTISLEQIDQKSKGNLKTRLRMAAIYGYANSLNYLVLGTTNKCEYYLGYFSKWGDGAADIYPILDLNKSDIYQLAKSLKVNKRVIDVIPTSDLCKDQSDEQELGFSYREFEDYMNGKKVSEAVKTKIISLHQKNSHKQIPLNKFKYQK